MTLGERREIPREQALVRAARHYLPSLGRSHRRKVWTGAIADLFILIDQARREDVPPRLVIETAAHEGDKAVIEVAEQALGALDRGHAVEDVLTMWNRVLDENWSHLGHRTMMPDLPAASAASLRMHAEWSRRIQLCRRQIHELTTSTAAMRTSFAVVALMPIGITFIVSLINPAVVVRFFHTLGPIYGVALLFFGLIVGLTMWAYRTLERTAHPLTGFLCTFAAHLDAGADPRLAFDRARATLAPASAAPGMPELVGELRARGVDPDPLAPVAIALAAPAMPPAVRERTATILYDRACELEKSRVALSATSIQERWVWGGAVGAAGLATLSALLFWELVRPLL